VDTLEVTVPTPRVLIALVIRSLRLGGDEILDRDWDQYSESEHVEAQVFVHANFIAPAERLERLLRA
jgi:hypothetical protein